MIGLQGDLTVPLDSARRDVTLSGPDAVIAASALRCGAILVTTNPRHFPMEGLRVLAVDEEGNLLYGIGGR